MAQLLDLLIPPLIFMEKMVGEYISTSGALALIHLLFPGLGDITDKHAHEIPLPSLDDLAHLLDFASTTKTGYEHTLDLLRKQEDGSVTYIALGPLTNLALALRADEKLVKQKVGMVSIMGGNLDVPGNTSPVAEFNVWAVGFSYLIWRRDGFLLTVYVWASRTRMPHTKYSSIPSLCQYIFYRWISRQITPFPGLPITRG